MSSRAFKGILGSEESADLIRIRRALAQLPGEMAQRVYSAGREQLTAGWTQELASSNQFSDNQRRIVTANPRVIAHSFGLSVKTGGQGKLGFLTRQFEFGTLGRDEYTTYTRRAKKGGSFTVRRRTARQLPTRSQTGWIAYPAAGRWAKRAFNMYLQIIVKVSHDAIDGGR